jgi:hypothetical protein
MKSIAVRTSIADWAIGTAVCGPGALHEGVPLVQVKVLSDRRHRGGGLAYLVKFRPPAGKLIKIVAVARSDEHTCVGSILRASPTARSSGSRR